jgi:hypothetical protein
MAGGYIHSLGFIQTPTSFVWVFAYDSDNNGQADSIYTYESGVVTDITGTTLAATSSANWNVCNLNSFIILNNGSDPPQYWNGSDLTVSDLPYTATSDWGDGTGTTTEYSAQVIRSFKSHLFALNITDDTATYPQMVHFSGAAEPGTLPSWDYTSPTTGSGRTQLSDTDGAVVDAVPLRDSLIIYKEDAIYAANFIGGTFIFQFRLITTARGLWGPNCAVDIGGRHVCLGDGAVYVHDGGEPKPILEGRAADKLFFEIDPDSYRKVFLTHNPSEYEVWICYPQLGSSWCDRAMVWNYSTNSWYERDIPECSMILPGIIEAGGDEWDDETALDWDDETVFEWSRRTYSPIGDTLMLAGTQLMELTDTPTTDPVTVTRTDLVFETPTDWYMARRLMLRASGDDLKVEHGTQEYIEGPVSWGTQQVWSPGDTRKLDIRQSGPVHAIRISCDCGNYWQLYSYQADVVKVGNR